MQRFGHGFVVIDNPVLCSSSFEHEEEVFDFYIYKLSTLIILQ